MIHSLAMTLALSAFMAGTSIHTVDQIADGQWFHILLNTTAAHRITKGDGVIVAVIDTGVDAMHPDLAGSVLPGTDLAAGSDGRVDADGHGTGLAGLIAAHGKVNGVAPQARILPVRVVDTGLTPMSKVAQGITWAVDHGAKVIIIATGGRVDDGLVRERVEAAKAADVVIVAAAGNKPDADDVIFPAAIDGVVAVGGVDKSGNVAQISATGPQLVIAAPCDKVSTTGLRGTHFVSDGTSLSAAIVAGAAALVRSKFPTLKAPEVVHRLTATAIDKGNPGRDSTYGYGVLNLVGALTADVPAASPTSTTTAEAQPKPNAPTKLPVWWLIAVPILAVLGTATYLLTRRRN